MKSKIFLSMLVIMVALSMVVGGTMAYFSDSGTSSSNTFTAGTLKMLMSNDALNWGDDVTATWSTPANWAPGESTTGKISFTNVGTVDAHHLWFNFEITQDSILLDKIIVTDVSEVFNGVSTGNQAATVALQVGDNNNVLTARELLATDWYTWDNISNHDDNVIGAGNLKDYSLSFTFKFDENATDEYQGLSAIFNLGVSATQGSPTEGYICFH